MIVIFPLFNILECSRRYKPKQILFASSSSVYGDNKTFPLKETFLRNPKIFMPYQNA